MEDKLISSVKKEFENILAGFQEEISKINIGRASISLVEDLPAKYYGTTTPIKKIAQISAPDTKTIVVQPWDKTSLADIEKAINDSELNLRATNDGLKIVISLPPMTEERRTELTKVLKAREEEVRISLRNIRQKVWEDIQEKRKKSELTEDDQYSFEEDLNKTINDYNKKVEEIAAKKINEIMTV